jgi:putative ABC transport system permease protein
MWWSPTCRPRFLPELTAREHDPGVTGHSGSYPVASAVMRAGRYATAVIAEGRDQAPAPVDQPKVIQGTWVRPGDVVPERGFADAPGIGAGDSVTFNGRPFRVAGLPSPPPSRPTRRPASCRTRRGKARN